MSVNAMVGKKAGPVDKFIGKKIKIKRIQFGISQKKLGDSLGITFQQLQKCENGLNRTPASRLYEMTKIFNVPINYFFEGVEDFLRRANKPNSRKKSEKEIEKQSRELEIEILKLNRYFMRIEDKQGRKLVIEITKELGKKVI